MDATLSPASDVAARRTGGAGAPPSARPAGRASLAIVMMTKNEAHRLAACLDRVAGWASEIVIIDDESRDRTVEIARGYGATVAVMPSGDDHFLQWNRGIDRAVSEWILHIDADEWVTLALKAAIDAALSQPTTHAAFTMMRRNYFVGHPMRGGGWHHPHLILFRRGRARCEGTGIHSRLKVSGTIGHLNADIDHFPFTSVSQFIDRQNHYTNIEAGVAAAGPAVSARTVRYQMTWRPLKLFWKTYVKKGARHDGWHGFVFSLLFAFAHWMHWVKYYEQTHEPRA